MINLVVQSFGRENEYRRAALTVLSFYAYCSLPVSQTSVFLFTDRPDWFAAYFHDLPVKYVVLTPEKIKVMRGEIDFLHRMKIALIEEAFDKSEGDMLYADSDTFFTSDPTPLMEQLSSDKSFMHVHEYHFEHLRSIPLPDGETFQAFLKLIESKKVKLTDGTELQLTSKHSSWNAGVMMLHRSHRAFIPDVYALTEQFYPLTRNHASEQYAFSILLQLKTMLQPCEEVIYHYWYRVRKRIIDEFLLEKFSQKWIGLTLSEKIATVKSLSTSLPGYMDKHLYMLQDNAIQAFSINRIAEGYKWFLKAFVKAPHKNKQLFKDLMYYTKRAIKN